MEQVTQYLNAHAGEIATILTLLLTLIKSETLAMNNSTAANGILHGYRLAQAALSTVQPIVAALEPATADSSVADQEALPKDLPPAGMVVAQTADLSAAIAAKQAELAALQAQAQGVTGA